MLNLCHSEELSKLYTLIELATDNDICIEKGFILHEFHVTFKRDLYYRSISSPLSSSASVSSALMQLSQVHMELHDSLSLTHPHLSVLQPVLQEHIILFRRDSGAIFWSV